MARVVAAPTCDSSCIGSSIVVFALVVCGCDIKISLVAIEVEAEEEDD